jgi:outer membrane autotransporter protein
MPFAPFRKTLLALAVSFSPALFAETTIHLDGSAISITPGDYNTPLVLTGAAHGSTHAVELGHGFSWSLNFLLGLTNQASLSSNSETTRTLALRGNSESPWGMAIMFGNLQNQGQITALGANSSGLFIGDQASLMGTLRNTGNIEGNGDGSAGVRLQNQAMILGDFHNEGRIAAEGNGSRGMALSQEWITGALNNGGSIVAEGAQSIALELGNSSWIKTIRNEQGGQLLATGDYSRGISISLGESLSQPMSLENQGRIYSEGRESIGVFIDHSTNLPILVNSGDIESRGRNSRAVVLGNGYTSNASISGLQLINTGTLAAEGIAVEALASSASHAPYPWLQVDMWDGLIEGKEAAIKGAGNILLNFEGGEIRGDLLGLQEMYASGDATFNGTLIQTPVLWVTSLELGQPHTRLEGELRLNDTQIDLSLHKQTNPRRAILEIDGDAIFGYLGHSQIRLKPTSSDFRNLPLREYILISANQVHDQAAEYGLGLQVTSLSDLLHVESYKVTDTQITAQVRGVSAAQADDYLRQHGAQAHVLPAFNAFYSQTLGQLDDDDPLFTATISSNDEQLVRLAQQLAPEVNGASSQTAISNHNLLGTIVQNRSAGLRGLSSGDGLSETGVWVQVLNSDADQGTRNGIPGYDADSQGIAIGADGKLNAQTTLGLAYSYLTSDVRSQIGNKTDIEGHALTLYSSYQQGPWFVDAGLTYGQSDNRSKRYIAGTRADGDYDSALWGLSLLGGYALELGHGLLLEPRAVARYSNVELDGYREKGSAAALTVGGQRYEVGELGAGLRLAGSLAAGAGRLEPEATLMAYHDLIADQTSSTSSFVVGGTPFTTHGAKPARESYEASLGVNYHLGAVSLGLSYDYLTKTDFSSDTVQAKLRYAF